MKKFTIIEVLIAFTILVMVSVLAIQTMGNSKRSIFLAEQDWARQHLLANCAEYYLLMGHDADLPNDFFPAGISASCELSEVEIENDQESNLMPKGWALARYTIRLYDHTGEIASQEIDKIVPETEL